MAFNLRLCSKLHATSLLRNVSRHSMIAPLTQHTKIVSSDHSLNFSNFDILFVNRKTLQPSIRSIFISAANQSVSQSGHHSTLWTVERILSAGLFALLPAAIAFPCQPLDALLATTVVMHQYWGLEACVIDYVRPAVVGNILPKLTHGLLLIISAATLGGLFYFIYTDIGIGNGVRKLWAVKAQ